MGGRGREIGQDTYPQELLRLHTSVEYLLGKNPAAPQMSGTLHCSAALLDRLRFVCPWLSLSLAFLVTFRFLSLAFRGTGREVHLMLW